MQNHFPATLITTGRIFTMSVYLLRYFFGLFNLVSKKEVANERKKMYVEAEWCKELNLDKIICQNVPDIANACYVSCAKHGSCRDQKICHLFSNHIESNHMYCLKSNFVRENCPKGCSLC